MKLIDVNLLLYAINQDGPHHARSKSWLEQTLADEEPVALPWAVVLGFLCAALPPRAARPVFPSP